LNAAACSCISSYSGAPLEFFSANVAASFKLIVEEAKESAAAAERAAAAAELKHSEAARRAAMPHNNPSPFRPFTPANNMKRKAS
jgi:hypothetical protein